LSKPKPRALVLTKDGLHYRRAVFINGLKTIGFETKDHISDPGPQDVLVIWNRNFRGAEDAERFERHGARVIVAENGYMGKGWLGGNWYSLAFGHHAGVGHWNVGGPERWDNLKVDLKPWRMNGTENIILGQRGIGERGLKSPEGWAEATQARLGGRIRKHPGRNGNAATLEEDLTHATSVVTWASSAALQALLHGVPVWYEMPGWIGAAAARPIAEFGGEPLRDDAARLAMFRRLAWSMWQIDEIDNGTAFQQLFGYST